MSHGVSIMDLKYQQEKSWDVEPVFGHLQNDRYGRNAEIWKKEISQLWLKSSKKNKIPLWVRVFIDEKN